MEWPTWRNWGEGSTDDDGELGRGETPRRTGAGGGRVLGGYLFEPPAPVRRRTSGDFSSSKWYKEGREVTRRSANPVAYQRQHIPGRREDVIFGLLVCSVCGAGILGAAFMESRRAGRLRREGLRIQGTVIGYREVWFESSKKWASIICFTDNLGRRVEFSPSVRLGRKWPLGRTVKVIYLPDKPNSARVESWWELLFTTLALLVFGTTVIGLPVAAVIVAGH
jgi:hypothetical protein